MKSKTMKLLCVTLAVLMLAFAVAGCGKSATTDTGESTKPAAQETPKTEPSKTDGSKAPAASDSGEKKLMFGLIAHDRAIEWVNYGCINFEYACQQKGITPVIADAQNNMEKVLSGMEDLIAKKVDAVSVYSFSPDLDKRVAQMARSAGIPIVFENAVPADDVDYDSVTVCKYYDIGYAAGKFVSEKYPNSKLVYIMGQPGMNITEPYMEGLKKALADNGSIVELVESQPTNWTAEQALNVTQNVIQSGKKFDVIFANNEQIAQGVISALKDAGLHGKVPILATGGSTLGIDMIKKGDLTATLSAPVSFQGMMSVKKLLTLLNGGTVEKLTPVPIIPITKDNLDDVIPWDPGDKVIEAIGGLDVK